MLHSTLFVIACAVSLRVAAGWSCSADAQCASLSGGVCVAGACVCPAGQLPVFGATRCEPFAPYYSSQCVQESQCYRLLTGFECRADETAAQGNCLCQDGFHYLQGRCWRSRDVGESCQDNEECMGAIRDPYSMVCSSGICECDEQNGYIVRQQGECRKYSYNVGDACVMDLDCQFSGGVCNNFVCGATATRSSVNRTQVYTYAAPQKDSFTDSLISVTRELGSACEVGSNTCPAPLECMNGLCYCPSGYYENEDASSVVGCLAELGSPATEAQCTGLLAELKDGVCVCPVNFFYDENMRDCIKVVRKITDACVMDVSCHTFGTAARCGQPGEHQLRSCECNPEVSVWDEENQVCRAFVSLGEVCVADSDCFAGGVQISCQQGVCVCPEDFAESDGLCLAVGLNLGDQCRADSECTGTDNSICANGVCGCAQDFRILDGTCSPDIGGPCAVSADCRITHAVCAGEANATTCQCDASYVAYNGECYNEVTEYSGACTVAPQCASTFGEYSDCVDSLCVCTSDTHFRDGGCWPRIALFETCSRSSECYLSEGSERVVCRNGLCQCHFDNPYDEKTETCTSSANVVVGSILLVVTAVINMVSP